MKLSTLLSIAVSLLFHYPDSAFAQNRAYVPFDKSKLDLSSFFEQFDYDALHESNWKVSHATKPDQSVYEGEWDLDTPTVFPGFFNDKALAVKTPAAYHAISYVLDSPFDNTDRDLVLQYEVKAEKGINCAGAYIKLLDAESVNESGNNFSNRTPFQIMFGPDKCGESNKLQFIIRRENPISGSMEEKVLTSPPLARSGKLSTLYTLILRKSQDFEIRINGRVAKAGNLVSDPSLLYPQLNPSKESIDIHDVQPDDWDDDEYIPDPEITEKPADYDEKYYSHTIDDPRAVIPEDWDESEPEFIIDPEAEIPEDWDEEEDGNWEGPIIANPKCVTIGCGKWSPPRIPNPNYKGPWIRPVIPNPNYQGEWKPRTIPNPNYYEDLTPSNLKLIGGIGFELWTMENQIMFDNIYLGHSIEEAELIGNYTFTPKEILERESHEANRPRAKNEPVPPPKNFDDLFSEESESSLSRFYEFISETLVAKYSNVESFYLEFRLSPLETIVKHPFKFVAYCIGFVFTFTLTFGLMSTFVYLVSGPIATPERHETSPSTLEEKEEKEEVTTSAESTGSKTILKELKATRRR